MRKHHTKEEKVIDGAPPLGCDYMGYEFGAGYLDSCCYEGYLWDMDSCEFPGGPLLSGGDIPCPECNHQAWLEYMREDIEGDGYTVADQGLKDSRFDNGCRFDRADYELRYERDRPILRNWWWKGYWERTLEEQPKVLCISLWQPWASLVALNFKRIETRGWAVPKAYRGKPLVIHAAKKPVRAALRESRCSVNLIGEMGRLLDCDLNDLPLGALLSIGRLEGSQPSHELERTLTRQEKTLGFYGAGRHGWLMDAMHALEKPIPFKGQQGFFSIDSSLLGLNT